MTIEKTGPNAEQIEYWNEVSGAKWVELQDRVDAQIEPLGREAMERAGLRAGERVLDVGCGCGQTVLQIAERVGPEGAVVGVDISAPMLARAGERSRDLPHVSLRNADAQTVDFGAERFDAVFSRFGVMFFSDPAAAFANIHAALAPGGRLAFVCWQAIKQNPWMLVPTLAVAKHVEIGAPPDPTAPGPFAFADPERVRGLLEAGGFRDVAFEPLEREMSLGGGVDLDTAAGFATQMGPAGRLLREATDEVRAAAAASVREALAPFATPEGVRLESASWVVTASA